MVPDYCTHHSLGCRICTHAVSFEVILGLEWMLMITGISPRSMEGGDLRWFWSGFERYERIDKVLAPSFVSGTSISLWVFQVYSVSGYHDRVGFAPAAGESCRAVNG